MFIIEIHMHMEKRSLYWKGTQLLLYVFYRDRYIVLITTKAILDGSRITSIGTNRGFVWSTPWCQNNELLDAYVNANYVRSDFWAVGEIYFRFSVWRIVTTTLLHRLHKFPVTTISSNWRHFHLSVEQRYNETRLYNFQVRSILCWRHDMETLSALLALCRGQRANNVRFWCSYYVSRNKLLNKQSSDERFKTLWRSCDATVMKTNMQGICFLTRTKVTCTLSLTNLGCISHAFTIQSSKHIILDPY